MQCSCGGDCETKLIYACSGAANTGFLADQVARKLAREGAGEMTCLAAMGAELSGFIESARATAKNIMIDGCPMACGKKILEAKGIPFEHFILTEFGIVKGKTPITGEIIETVFQAMKEKV
jgi:uncharacterized metal-binding protein